MRLITFIVLVFGLIGPTYASSIPLKILSLNRGIHIGSALRSAPLHDDSAYSEFARTQFSILTAENDFKFDSIQPEENVFDFSRADRIVEFAKKNRQLVRGHTLVWHNPEALPAWLTQKKRTPSELKKILKNHIQTTLRHFKKTAPGIVVSWDVINEAFDDEGNFRKDSPWASIEKTPFSFFSWVYHLARKIDPSIKLYYNDYGIEFPGKKSKAVFQMLKKLKSAGVPIDGIGFQAHGSSKWGTHFKELSKVMTQFEKIGLRIQITEMDFSTDGSHLGESLQSEAYSNALNACLQVRACNAFITWGFTDRYLWKGNFPEGFGWSTYLDAEMKPKSSFHAIRDTLRNSKRPITSSPN